MRNSFSHPSQPLRVLLLRSGQLGCGIAGLVVEKPGLVLVGAYGRRTERAGMDLGRAIALGRDCGLPISADLTSVIAASVDLSRLHKISDHDLN